MANDMVLTKHEAIEKAESRSKALANMKHKVKVSAQRMADTGMTIAGGFLGGVLRGKMPTTEVGGFHVNQIGGGVAVAVGLMGVFDDTVSDWVCSLGAGTLAFELGRKAESTILNPPQK